LTPYFSVVVGSLIIRFSLQFDVWMDAGIRQPETARTRPQNKTPFHNPLMRGN
jgi:hypothetical protein